MPGRVHTSGEAAIQAVRDRIQQASESAAGLRGQADAAEEETRELQQERDGQSGGRVKTLSAQADELAKRCLLPQLCSCHIVCGAHCIFSTIVMLL